jgi:diaminohydroxyphosphoribosylaminopyrimidine deaminase/5-amino-6-(5-phosphoribosylamino)uracil reductase
MTDRIGPPPAFRARAMLDLAARLALRAAGNVEPNPLVGCVLTRTGGEESIIGLGHHRRFGGLHAEREALADCRSRGIDPRGCTAYVTLEPCNAQGKQPACVDALLEAGAARVIFATRDPNPPKAGGAERLRSQGLEVYFAPDLGARSALAESLIEPFAKRVATGLPWVIVKWAQTIDGRIATRTGESKWISGPMARRRVHRLRGRVDAVLTGMGTILADDPMLTARDVRRVRRVARRVVLDTELSIPLDCAIVRSAKDTPATVFCDPSIARAEITAQKRWALGEAGVEVLGITPTRSHLDLTVALRTLAEKHGVATVLVEAGSGLMGALFEQDLVDEAVVYVAPLVLGDEAARSVATGRVASTLSMGRAMRLLWSKRVGPDVELVYRRAR